MNGLDIHGTSKGSAQVQTEHGENLFFFGLLFPHKRGLSFCVVDMLKIAGMATLMPRLLCRSGVVSSLRFSSSHVFDQEVKKIQKSRCALDPEYDNYHHLRNAVGDLLIDRLADVKASHTRFKSALDIGSRYSTEALASLCAKGGVESLLQMDSSQEVLNRTQTNHQDERLPAIHQRVHPEDTIPDEEGFQNFDLVTSNLALHWVNDLPTIFGQIKKSLRPDGLALVSVFGGDTLHELRDAFLVAEQEREGRVAVRVSPLIGVADAGSLLSRAQMTLTTVDVETIVVRYSDMFQLMDDLRGMGESSAAILRGAPLKRSTLFAAASAYKSMYGEEDGTIPATFQVIFLTGWHPDNAQQQPKRRGSARLSLKDLDQVDDIAQEEQLRNPHKTFTLSDLGEAFPLVDEEEPKKK